MDIALRFEDFRSLDFAKQVIPTTAIPGPVELIGFGWGERIFYTEVKEWGDLTSRSAHQRLRSP